MSRKPNGSGLQPSNLSRVPILGRCPRLVWGRAFGPVEASRCANLILPFFSPEGATHTSPGHRPGFTFPLSFSSPEGARHSPRA